jgi:hypothetical protein
MNIERLKELLRPWLVVSTWHTYEPSRMRFVSSLIRLSDEVAAVLTSSTGALERCLLTKDLDLVPGFAANERGASSFHDAWSSPASVVRL